jgi:drug/metabolite transporter (DMT)-like permease
MNCDAIDFEGNDMDLLQLIIAIIVLLISWAILSIPLWLAAKVLTAGKATLGAAMIGMLLGGIVFLVVYAVTYLVTDTFTSSSNAVIIASMISFLAFLGLYKILFDVGWLKALAIAILAIIFTVIMYFIIAAILVALGLTVL